MKDIFELNKDMLFNKPVYKLTPSDDCIPYMHQRWISFIDPGYCNLLNDIYNNQVGAFADHQQFYDFLKCILPRKKVFKIKYMKKNKVKAESSNETAVEELAATWELPKKEVREILTVCPELLKSFKEDLKVLKKVE